MHLTGQPNSNHRSPGLGAAVHRAQLGEFYDSSTNDSSIDHQPVRRDFDDEPSSSVEHHLAPGWTHDHADYLNPANGIVSHDRSTLLS
jgi:hypothetical protein